MCLEKFAEARLWQIAVLRPQVEAHIPQGQDFLLLAPFMSLYPYLIHFGA